MATLTNFIGSRIGTVIMDDVASISQKVLELYR